MRGARDKKLSELAYPATPFLVFGLFLGFVFFRYLQGGYRFPALGTIRFEAIVGSILLIAAIFVRFRHKPVRLESMGTPPRLAGWVAALLLLMLVHVFTSLDPRHSWDIFIDRVVKFGLFGFMIFSFVTSPLVLRYFMAAYLLAFLKMAQEGVIGYLTGTMVWENQGIRRLHGPTPSYHHPNSFGGTQLSTLPFIASFWSISPLWIRLALGALGVGALLISIFSGSRTAYLALVAWAAFMIYRARSRFRVMVLLVAALLLISPFVPSDYYDRFSTIFSQQEIEGASMDLRKEIFSDAIEIFMRHPFGVGVAAFPTVRYDYFGRSQDTHSLYLEIATNLGIPGLIIFTGLIIALFRSLSFVQKRMNLSLEKLRVVEVVPNSVRDEHEKQIAELLLIRQTALALTGFLIIRLALGLFGHDLYEIYWWFVIGLTAALVRMSVTAEIRVESAAAVMENQATRQGA